MIVGVDKSRDSDEAASVNDPVPAFPWTAGSLSDVLQAIAVNDQGPVLDHFVAFVHGDDKRVFDQLLHGYYLSGSYQKATRRKPRPKSNTMTPRTTLATSKRSHGLRPSSGCSRDTSYLNA